MITLTFTLLNNGVDKIVTADVSQLIDTYTAGDGLVLEDKKFSVDINNETEPYLVLSNEGIGIFGINSTNLISSFIFDSETSSIADVFLTKESKIYEVVNNNIFLLYKSKFNKKFTE